MRTNAFRRRRCIQLTPREQKEGFVFLGLYVLVFPVLKPVVEDFFDRNFGLYLSEALSAALYHAIMVLVTVVLFRPYLEQAFRVLLDRLPENLFALVTGLVGAGVLHLLVILLPYPVENPNTFSWAVQFASSPAATAVIVVLLMPFAEEVLFRGLLYDCLYRYGRPLAWTVSVLAFLLYSVWTFAVVYGDARYLLLAVQYLPMSLALTWCYERGGSIWSAFVLHALINGWALISALSSTVVY